MKDKRWFPKLATRADVANGRVENTNAYSQRFFGPVDESTAQTLIEMMHATGALNESLRHLLTGKIEPWVFQYTVQVVAKKYNTDLQDALKEQQGREDEEDWEHA